MTWPLMTDLICYWCGLVYALPKYYVDMRADWKCPNGHDQSFKSHNVRQIDGPFVELVYELARVNVCPICFMNRAGLAGHLGMRHPNQKHVVRAIIGARPLLPSATRKAEEL